MSCNAFVQHRKNIMHVTAPRCDMSRSGTESESSHAESENQDTWVGMIHLFFGEPESEYRAKVNPERHAGVSVDRWRSQPSLASFIRARALFSRRNLPLWRAARCHPQCFGACGVPFIWQSPPYPGKSPHSARQVSVGQRGVGGKRTCVSCSWGPHFPKTGASRFSEFNGSG